MSLYSDYLTERTDDGILELTQGFATYRYLPDNIIYVLDVFVAKDFRKTGLAKTMIDRIAEESKAKGFKKMVTTVVPSYRGAARSIKVILDYGFIPQSSSDNLIIFGKDL